MKRLIMVSMMFVSSLVYADDAAVPSAPETIQSASDTSLDYDESAINVANIHHINLDNTEFDGGGNWLNKRIWYERSQVVFDEIRSMVNAIGDLRIQFSNEVNAVGQKIDSFWETVDYTKGQLDDKFKEMLIRLETEQKLTGDLSPEERNLQVTIKQELTVVEQIGKDIKAIHDVDDKIDDTFKQALKTIDECRDYESKSWDSFKAVGKELDDKKARNIYYQMNNYKQNIDQKSNYLKTTLLPYLHNVLVAKVEMNISKINQAVATLKTKGIDLEKIMSKTQEDDLTKIHAREKEAAEIAVKKALEAEEKKAKEIAKTAANALEEANKKSFNNVVHHYYQATIGKIVDFVYQGFVGNVIDTVSFYVKSYSFPLATYAYSGIMSVKAHMQNIVRHIMIYFGSEEAITKIVEEKAEVKEHVADKVKEKIEEKLAAVHEKSDDNQDEKKSEEVKSDQPVADDIKKIEPVSVVSKSDDKSAVVQSLQKEEKQQQSHASGLYHVLKTIFDLITTIIISIYNCILQFFKLLMSFAAYIMSGN